MIIVGLPDTHGDNSKLKAISPVLKQADLILLLGDITNFGHQQEMKETFDWVGSINKNFLAVPGNCDFPDSEEIMDQYGVNINGGNRTIDGKNFVGLGASLPTPHGGTPYEVSEDHLELKLNQAVAGLDLSLPMILVSHQPPIYTKTDAVNENLHVGSKSVRSFIEKHQPMVCFTGHIHEGQGIDAIGNTQIINPSPVFKGFYSYAEITNEVEILEIRTIP